MNIKYLAFDLDGTLLTSQGFILSSTIKSINKLKKSMRIILASGRHYYEMNETIKTLQLSEEDWIICCDGQYIYNGVGELIWSNMFLNTNDIYKIKEMCGDYNKMICVTDKQDYLVTHSITIFLLLYIKNMLIKKNNRKLIVSLFCNHLRINDNNIEKIVMLTNNMKIRNKLCGYYTVHKNNNTYEILHKYVNKYTAIKHISNEGDVDLEQILYFGDSFNDIECFENLKYCVAMGNATDIIKKSATYVTKGNDDGGIACVLSKLSESI